MSIHFIMTINSENNISYIYMNCILKYWTVKNMAVVPQIVVDK
jgi:hypothetical protein